MKTTGAVAILAVLMFSPGVVVAGDAVAGKVVFMKKCATCHAEDGNGKPAVAKMMKTTIPALPSKDVQAISDDDMRKGIISGKEKMKPIKDLSAADIANVIAYVRSLAKS